MRVGIVEGVVVVAVVGRGAERACGLWHEGGLLVAGAARALVNSIDEGKGGSALGALAVAGGV